MGRLTRCENSAHWSFSHRRTRPRRLAGRRRRPDRSSTAAGSDYRDSFKLSGTDSSDALALLQQSSPQTSGDVDHIVIAAEERRRRSPNRRSRSDVTAMLDKVEGLPHVGAVVSPLRAGRPSQISRTAGSPTRRSRSTSRPTTSRPAAIDRVIDVARGSRRRRARGRSSAARRSTRTNQPSAGGTAFGFVAAAIVLFIVFGSLFADAVAAADRRLRARRPGSR